MDLGVLFNKEQIHEMVRRIADDISVDLDGENPIFVGVLNGSFVFLSDLVRMLNFSLEIDFICAKSYGNGMKSSGSVEITKDVEANLDGRHVVVVEDIADTGLTIDVVMDTIWAKHPASVRSCALLARESCEFIPDYYGEIISDGFVVGYGIDCAEKYRQLPEIYVVT